MEFLVSFVKTHKIESADKKFILKILAYENQIRGGDSVGFAAFNPDSKPYVLKSLNKVESVFQEVKNFDKIYEKQIVIGHVRKASLGEKNNDNIHPFIYKHIVLAHNGTIANIEELKEATKENWDNDSRHLIKLIAETGVTTPAKGSQTLVYYDFINKKLNIIKFEREIYVIQNENIIVSLVR